MHSEEGTLVRGVGFGEESEEDELSLGHADFESLSGNVWNVVCSSR